jgi:hypothetical protein
MRMELERPRKMELLHTPKSELQRIMKENSVTMDEVVFLFMSNKVTAADVRMNAPTICDKLLTMFLRQAAKQATSVPPMTA